MANHPRTEEGFASAMRLACQHTEIHTSTIYIYISKDGKEYITSIIDPRTFDDMEEGSGVGEFTKESFSDDYREEIRITTMARAMADAPDQTAALEG